jgi:hypothetical protein
MVAQEETEAGRHLDSFELLHIRASKKDAEKMGTDVEAICGARKHVVKGIGKWT